LKLREAYWKLLGMRKSRVFRTVLVYALVIVALSMVGDLRAWSRFLGANPVEDQEPRGSQGKQVSASDLSKIFQQGQAALQSGDLNTAEAMFRKVVAADPGAAAAYVNLGVVAMRRKDWDRALALLQKAQRLDPKMAGIRLNIGLVQFRRANYSAAIEPLSSVVREQPESEQARYLLGLSEIFTGHNAEAIAVLEPLWPKMSGDVMYLYALDIAAHYSKQTELDEKILRQMLETGKDTPEFHLIMAKAYLNRQEYEKAIGELDSAEKLNERLPYLHFNRGMAYLRLREDEKAEAEFKKDIAIEPDLADNYEQLGLIYWRLEKEEEAETNFRSAIKYDPRAVASRNGLAKVYVGQKRYQLALQTLDAAIRVAPDTETSHFLRVRVLKQLGREKEAQTEMAIVKKLLDSGLEKDQKSLQEQESLLPNPELTREPK
jgi:tetratricopeptide (TPR) repeat protein